MTESVNQLTDLDMVKLAYPFPRADHSFLQGYVYIEEEAITARLDTVDPNWSLSIDEAIGYGDSIAVRSTLTIKGVSRSNIGGNPVQREKEKKEKQGNQWVGTGEYVPLPLYSQADNGVNAYKAAATDALKRCARMFGVGRYLLSAPKEGGQFDEWLKRIQDEARTRFATLNGVDTSTGEIKRPANGNGHEPDSVPAAAPSAKVVGVQPQRPTPLPTVSTPPTTGTVEESANDLIDFGAEQGATTTAITATAPSEQLTPGDYQWFACHKVLIQSKGKRRDFIFKADDGRKFTVPEAKVNNLKTEVVLWASGKPHDLPTTVWVEARPMDETEEDWDVRNVSDEVKPE